MLFSHCPYSTSRPGLGYSPSALHLVAPRLSRSAKDSWSSRKICLAISPDPHDYFQHDPHGFDLDDYDQCVLGAESEQTPDVETSTISWDDIGSTWRLLAIEGGRAGKKLAKYTGSRVGSGVKLTLDHLPAVKKKSASAIRSMAQKVVGKENVTKLQESVHELPEGWLARVFWFWEQPFVKLGRLTVFFARLPAVWALALTQFGLVAGQLSLPMLPPLLLGAGMLTRSVWVNANIIFPRIYIIAILLYITWFANSVIQKTVVHFKQKGTVDSGFATTIINWAECTAILAAAVIILSMLGVKVSGLFLPAGICLALASKDVSYNFVAGIFLFLVQPFCTGDKVSVQTSVTDGEGGKWLEGICEKIDLRYTILRSGSYQLFIPNKSFMTREFLVRSEPNTITQENLWDNNPGSNISTANRKSAGKEYSSGLVTPADIKQGQEPALDMEHPFTQTKHASSLFERPFNENYEHMQDSPIRPAARAHKHNLQPGGDSKNLSVRRERDPGTSDRDSVELDPPWQNG